MQPESPDPEQLPLSPLHRGVRVLGALLLTICAVMVVLGLSVWVERLQGLRFLLYWSWCLLLTLAALGVAVWDLALVRRAFARRRRELFRREFIDRDLDRRGPAPPPPTEAP